MRKIFNNLFIIFILTILILLSYALLQGKLISFHKKDIFHFVFQKQSQDSGDELSPEEASDSGQSSDSYRAVWLTYLEFNAYRSSVKTNDSQSFTKFYQHVIDKCKELHINHIIVQVRPFSDALYESDYFPWASCISGKQGVSPGYDPLKIMVDLTHKSNMKIEAWINPYRISSGDDINELAKSNPARMWAEKTATSRNVLTYEHALYYNPSSKQVRALIQNGIEEIVTNYKVDGIHMDDYFYPSFNENNFEKVFDAKEYKDEIEDGNISQSLSIADWRRYNVNQLVSGIYKRIKNVNSSVTFGISPAGNPANLRSNLEYYADIDTWVSKEGYIDYIMPQIYWGYTNEEAPFEDILKQWVDICSGSAVHLYAGLQLYRMGITDKTISDYKELQKAAVIKKQLRQIFKDKSVQGYCLFSFQYLDSNNTNYQFDSIQFSKKRKRILKEIEEYLKNKQK